MDDRMSVKDILAAVRQEDLDDQGREHPIDAISVVLLSAAILGTTNAKALIEFTRYSMNFISAIALNMKNNRLWVDGRYDSTEWFHPSDGIWDRYHFFEHNEIAQGVMWKPGCETIAVDSSQIYWKDHGYSIKLD